MRRFLTRRCRCAITWKLRINEPLCDATEKRQRPAQTGCSMTSSRSFKVMHITDTPQAQKNARHKDSIKTLSFLSCAGNSNLENSVSPIFTFWYQENIMNEEVSEVLVGEISRI
ncbi:uncharacterized protein LOC116849535 [Odontomachus brunneus]|uniref:uncharacterized protein LOC116849535 n=1 Tax=Odontomachus brunneus TaxID=486640 RepID=UPI0013F229F7|nr:uncharacterized protein LOC116849535 [Odontomachus brunneus]